MISYDQHQHFILSIIFPPLISVKTCSQIQAQKVKKIHQKHCNLAQITARWIDLSFWCIGTYFFPFPPLVMYVSRGVRNVGELSCISVYCMVSKEAYHDIDSILKNQKNKTINSETYIHILKYKVQKHKQHGYMWVGWVGWSWGGFGL